MSCHKTISLNDSHAAPPEEDRRPAEIEALSAEKPVNMTNQWYPFAKPDHFWMQWRFQVLQEMVSGYDLGERLIEVGCGNCVMRDKWEGYLSLPVDACDLNRTCLEMAGPARGRLFLYDVLDRRPEWQEHFSSIFLFDTLEHIEDPIWFLRAIGYHTQPGGLLVINVPALPSLYSAYDGVQGHVKRYTRSILAGELEAGGYQILESRYWGFTMIPIVALRKAWGAVSSEEKAVVNGFQPSSRAVDRFLRSLMTAERALLRNPVAGTSLAAIARKV
jgi:2-polyprenyl-3-methyl-5-hydroxy-6-metoxy-1,4-benzoquinol methylase